MILGIEFCSTQHFHDLWIAMVEEAASLRV